MVKLNREQAISLAALFLVLLACVLAPVWSLKVRSDALQELTDERDMLGRREAAHQRSSTKLGARGQITTAPAEAFLNAQTPGLAKRPIGSLSFAIGPGSPGEPHFIQRTTGHSIRCAGRRARPGKSGNAL